MLAPVELAQHLLTFLETATRPLLGAESAWFAIVLLTVLVRVALLPLAVVQARAARAQLGLQPEIAALRKRYANQPERLQEALAALYRERGVRLLPGCLPLVLQLPVMWVVYQVVRASAFGGALFGVPLSTALLAAPPPLLLALLSLLAATAALSALLAGRATPATSGTPGGSGAPARPVALVTRLLPFTVVPVALWLPLAVVVYLAVGNLCTLVQQTLLPVR
jgi:YidC/Oxa1 family membrane protein insertase